MLLKLVFETYMMGLRERPYILFMDASLVLFQLYLFDLDSQIGNAHGSNSLTNKKRNMFHLFFLYHYIWCLSSLFWKFIVLNLFFLVVVYRIYTSIIFHGSLLHVFFNMLALVPLGSELERIMGSVRLLYMIILLATTNAIFHLTIALVVAHNPFQTSQSLMNECAIGFSGILFSMIVIETSLSGVQSRRLVSPKLLWNNISLSFFILHFCNFSFLIYIFDGKLCLHFCLLLRVKIYFSYIVSLAAFKCNAWSCA